MSDKVMAILNNDERAKRLNTKFIALAEEQGLKGKDYDEARQTFLMMMIAGNKEAMNAMAEEVYEAHN